LISPYTKFAAISIVAAIYRAKKALGSGCGQKCLIHHPQKNAIPVPITRIKIARTSGYKNHNTDPAAMAVISAIPWTSASGARRWKNKRRPPVWEIQAARCGSERPGPNPQLIFETMV
jgi:hypothetical protein